MSCFVFGVLFCIALHNVLFSTSDSQESAIVSNIFEVETVTFMPNNNSNAVNSLTENEH